MDLIQPLQKSAHVIPLNKKYSNSSAETISLLKRPDVYMQYAQSSKTNYSDVVKINTKAPNIEEIVNQRVESIVQNITIKMEQQTTLLIEIFQKTIENLVQYLVTVFHQTDLKKSPNRKAK
ncbi:hypothetical protein CEXT_457511 [Caerostris extrusa]|uniref:Uncharacterized protein n=1 Tax=Caerostris extrusa TaxID=172846 RepID=A0AAV4S086_CAEEX|nr:hypothetical protein CEXT_457511 [Caerostris extrusa]